MLWRARPLSWATLLLAHARHALSTLVPGIAPSTGAIERALHQLVPLLGSGRHKGQSGKVGVLGGSLEYTGAPFYAAISALKVGADLSHVFCDVAAGTAIKSYSPELIVHPVLRSSNGAPQQASCDAESAEARARESADSVTAWFPALHVLVIGPGLGRDPALLAATALVMRSAAAQGLPTVVDADGLRIISEQPDVVRGEKALFVLTPNRVELARLYDALVPSAERRADAQDGSVRAVEARAQQLCARLGPTVVLVVKGPTDVIHDGSSALHVSEPGAPKRSGGQGDVLAGTLATFVAWSQMGGGAASAAQEVGLRPAVLAAYGACLLTRRFSLAAYAAHKRSMTAPDVIDAIGSAFEAWHPAPAPDAEGHEA